MVNPEQENSEWTEIGRTTASDKEITERTEVLLDDFYVVIGFEVNKPEAFKNKVQDLAIDYGHAFYYIVKNRVITNTLSFGPGGAGKVGWRNNGTPTTLKDGYANSRPGDSKYLITETVRAVKIKLDLQQGKSLEKETERMCSDIDSGKERYTAYLNDTCAETARDTLSDADVETPSGSGWVKHSDHLSFPIAYAVNPYMWHHNFIKKEFTEIVFEPDTDAWLPPIGDQDPLFGTE